MYLKITLLFLFIFFEGCAPSGPHRPLDPYAKAKGAVTFDQMRPIFAKNCAACHPSRSGPDWLDYPQAHNYVQNGLLNRKVVTERSMPPPGSPQAAAMTEIERQMIHSWILAGGPENLGPVVASVPEPSIPGLRPGSPVQQCLQCHGPQGPSAQAQPKIPRLNGQNYDYLIGQLQDFKWRRRLDPTDNMNDIVSGLKDEELEEAAHYYASKKGLSVDEPPKALTIVEQLLVEQGKSLAAKTGQNCVSCHMDPGAADSALPLLAGQSEQYLKNQLLYFRDRERRNNVMKEFTRTLSDQDIAALALFFSRSRPFGDK